MTENLNADTFRNGDPIPEAKTNIDWEIAGNERKPAWCYYNNDSINGEKYGKLYNWNAAKDPRGLAPEGWHVPDYREFDELIKNSGVGAKEVFKQLINGGSSGFNSFFCGWRDDKGRFYDLEKNTAYHSKDSASALNIRGDWQGVLLAGFPFSGIGFAIRCIKD